MNEGLELAELVDMILTWWNERPVAVPDFVLRALELRAEMEAMK